MIPQRFSDLERSLGIATWETYDEFEQVASFSDLERSLGIATASRSIWTFSLQSFQ